MEKLELKERNGYSCVHFNDLTYINTSVKWWVAKITGIHPKFKFNREFVSGFLYDSKRRKETYLPITKLPLHEVIEIAGGSWKNQSRVYIKPLQYDDEFLYYQPLKEGDVTKELEKDNSKEKAKELIKELINLVGKKEAVKLIKEG